MLSVWKHLPAAHTTEALADEIQFDTLSCNLSLESDLLCIGPGKPQTEFCSPYISCVILKLRRIHLCIQSMQNHTRYLYGVSRDINTEAEGWVRWQMTWKSLLRLLICDLSRVIVCQLTLVLIQLSWADWWLYVY